MAPKWISPMLATLYKEKPFDDGAWLFEKKFDGVRCLSFFDGKRVRLLTRNKCLVNQEYPELVEEIKKLSKKSFIVDGEIVVGEGKVGSFQKMQSRLGVKSPSKELQRRFFLVYRVFDLLWFDGMDVRKKPLLERKEALKKLSFSKRVRFVSHRKKMGRAFMKKMKAQGFEGAMAKRIDSQYVSKRSRAWLKLKRQNCQEFVVGGYTEPKGKRKGFGALLVGFYRGKKLLFAGKVGTGGTERELVRWHNKLLKLERSTSPFPKGAVKGAKDVHWVSPKLVVEVEFTEWTRDGKLRHPSLVGFREDKPSKTIRKEG